VDDEFEIELEADALGSLEGVREDFVEYPYENGLPDCFTQGEIDEIRSSLQGDFKDLELMSEIVEGDPSKVNLSR